MLHNAALVAVVAFAALISAYVSYGRLLARRIFRLNPNRPTPAHTLRDGIDYVPTRAPIVFGHHFASIAGLGPILGPAIAVIWGWGPALLWVVLGSIFIGAVHDLGALRMSLCYEGRSVGDICRHLMGQRARILALLLIFFMLALVLGAFCNTIADLFVNHNPDAIIPSVGLIVVAVVFGVAVYVFRAPLFWATLVALVIFGSLIFLGVKQPVPTHEWFCSSQTRAALAEAKAAPETAEHARLKPPYGAAEAVKCLTTLGKEAAAAEIGSLTTVGSAVWKANYAWLGALLFYAFLASVLPVWLLLQPRDYINSFQLYFALAAMTLGLCIAGFVGSEANHIEAPCFRGDVPDAPPVFPFLFVTVACGAVSGFHALVSSGTTVKQLNRESDALPIGYGAMLVEAALAVLVILACVAGLEARHWQPGGVYASWRGIGGAGLAVQLNAMFRGGANFLAHLGIPPEYGRTLLAVTVVSFALTTLDSAMRLMRFNIEEIARSLGLTWLANRFLAATIGVLAVAFFAVVPAGKALWTLFGASNQLLAGLTLLCISLFLFKLCRPTLYTLLPMLVMMCSSIWAMILSLGDFRRQGKWSLFVVTIIMLIMAGWIILEAVVSFRRGRNTAARNQSEMLHESAG